MTEASHTVAMLTMLPSVPYTSTEGNELSMIGFDISKPFLRYEHHGLLLGLPL
jgi:hypothetical protein